MESRAPKEVEDPRVAIFVKGTHVGEVLNNVMKELVCNHPYYSFFSTKLSEPRAL